MSAFAPPCTGLPRTTRKSVCQGPRMSLLSRRAALAAALAAAAGVALPKSAQAKSGDAPKISVFGVGGASSPFVAGVETGGTVQYKQFNDEEMGLFRRTVSESVDRLNGTIDAIKGKSWDDVRSRVRLEMNEIRRTAQKINDNLEDEKVASQARSAYSQFTNDIENLDYAAIVKNQAKAFKSYNSAVKNFANWTKLTGFAKE